MNKKWTHFFFLGWIALLFPRESAAVFQTALPSKKIQSPPLSEKVVQEIESQCQGQLKYLAPVQENLPSSLFQLIWDRLEEFTQVLNQPPHGNPSAPKKLIGLYLIDSEETVTAAVGEIPKPGSGQFAVFITKPLLQLFFGEILNQSQKDLQKKALQSDLQKLMGVLAHEVGHQSEFKKRSYFGDRQLEEARADLVAIDFLRKANAPPESILSAVTAVSQMSESQEEHAHTASATTQAASAFIHTHPAGELRSAIVRQALTLDPFRRGVPAPRMGLASEEQSLTSLDGRLFQEITHFLSQHSGPKTQINFSTEFA